LVLTLTTSDCITGCFHATKARVSRTDFGSSSSETTLRTPWQLLEHLRIAQDDILQFIKDADHCSPEWPDGFWPGGDEVADEERWNKSVDEFFKSLDEMEKFIKDDSVDLFTPLPHAENYTIFREILVLADHNSYHLGQIMLMQKLNG